jgi:tRNA threonylcarbamoyladenosine biosynthesis protein TsaE
MGIRDYFAEDTLNFIEWPDKGYGWLPGADIEIRIEYAGEGRKITFSALTEAGQRIIKTL